MTFRLLRYSAFAGLLSLIVCGNIIDAMAQQGRTGPPAGWTEHKDPRGFVVRSPKGWGVEAVDDGRIIISSADKSAFAVVQTFLLEQPVHAADWVIAYLIGMKKIFPEAQVQQRQQLSAQPDEVAATANFTVNGKPSQANALCSIMGRSGMLFAIAAPQDVFAATKPTLISVLNSVRFVQPTAHVTSGALDPTEKSAKISYVKWTAPQENAFTDEVPAGWKIAGGMTRISAVDTRNEVVATSPDGFTRLQVGDAGLSGFELPQPNVAEFHKRFPLVPLPPGEGQKVTLPTGLSFVVMRYRSGPDFSMDVAKYKFAKLYPDVRFANPVQADPGPIPQLGRDTVTAGFTSFTYNENGKSMAGFVYCATRLMPYPNANNGGTWFVSQLFIGTYPDELGRAVQAMRTMEHISNTQSYDRAWFQKQYRLDYATTKVYIQNVQDQMKISHDAFMKHMEEQGEKNKEQFAANMAAKDDTTRKWVNFALGQTDVRDPQTGETWKVAAGHNYYWADGGADATNATPIVGGDINPLRPDVNLRPLEQW